MPHTDTKYSPAPTSMKKTRSWSFHSVCRGWWDDWWLPEVFSALTGILAIFGIFIVLKAYDNGPIPNWGSVLNTTITLNTVLSILGTVVKMSLMMPVIECISQLKWPWFDQGRPLIDLNIFDQASRGPLGSIKLIWRLKAM